MFTSDKTHYHIKTVLRLQRGIAPRKVRITIETRLEEPDRIALGLVLGAFFEAAETGIFGPARVPRWHHEIEVRRPRGVIADVCEANVTSCRPGFFAALVDMVKASVPGVTSMEIRESDRDERTLVVRHLERDTEATILDVDWRIDFAASAPSHLVVRFVEPPTPQTAEKTARIVRRWSGLLQLGAYPPPDQGCSRAVLQYAGPGAAEELLFDFAALTCGYDAFEALFEALDAVHEQQQAIERVSIPMKKLCSGEAVAAALAGGGPDNITVALLRCEEPDALRER